MFNVQRVERQIGDHVISLETGKVAKQADGAVMVQSGETVVLVAVVTAAPWNEDIDYFPLSVDYRERHFAAGKFPGGFMKREGRPSTKETLTSRMIDRPIRPLFPDGYFQEVQVTASVMSYDGKNEPDVLAMIGASAALHISKIPFQGPIGACRVSYLNEQLVINPSYDETEASEMNLLLAGRKDSINMIEVDSKEVSEEVVADAVSKAHEAIGQICDMIEELREKAGSVEKEIILAKSDDELAEKIYEEYKDELYQAWQITDKQLRGQTVGEIVAGIEEKYCGNENEEDNYDKSMVKRILESTQDKVVKQLLLDGKRPDGRSYDQIRPITCEADVLPRTHGSALFTRGETQALVNVTLGTIRDSQIIDGLVEEYSQNFMLHYNFPPYSVGDVRPFRGPGRREIGHGALAEKALAGVKPDVEDFAYTIRIVSDITESNGSSSMASVCGGSLALLDAGVPLRRPVAGISVGLVTGEDGRYELLTDIIGDEDHYGDMDFKVAGTTEGITAIQLDIKAEGLPHHIMVAALQRAKEARLKILETMGKVISAPRAELSEYAPKLISIEIDPELIGKVIGPGGKMIKSIQEETDATIEIEEDGTIFISCVSGNGHLAAKQMIEDMTTPPKVGKTYHKSKIVSIKDFGVFVEIVPGVEGLCHISEISDEYVKDISKLFKTGDLIDVKLIAIDDQGRMKLSRKAVLQEQNKEQADSDEDKSAE